MFSFDTKLNSEAVTSFSGLLSISGPVRVCTVCVVRFAVVFGDVLRYVDPWKFFTVRLVKQYDLPVVKVWTMGFPNVNH